MDFIIYQNERYPYKEIKLPEFGNVRISIEKLSKALLNEKGSNYNSKEAQYIDEKIFFYVEEEKINLSEKALRKYFVKMDL